MKNKTRQIVALLVTAAMLTGCGAVQNQDVVSEQTKTQEETQTESVEEQQTAVKIYRLLLTLTHWRRI